MFYLGLTVIFEGIVAEFSKLSMLVNKLEVAIYRATNIP